jgi:hypothetical protein
MAVVCKKCGKSVSENLNACYSCGELLKATVKCSGCGKDNIADRAMCQYCGEKLGAAPVAKPVAAKGGSRLGFEEAEAPKPSAVAARPPAPVIVPPPARPVQTAPARPQTSMPGVQEAESARPLDTVLYILSLPVWVVGVFVVLLWQAAIIVLSLFTRRGGAGRQFGLLVRNIATFISRPGPVHYIVFGCTSIGVTMAISALSSEESPFIVRYAFFLMLGSAACAIVLGYRRWRRAQRKGAMPL